MIAEGGILGEEGDEDGHCGVNLLLKSLALMPVAPRLSAEAVDIRLMMLIEPAGGISAEAVVHRT
ncbi:hypothetical protein [Streptomyces sp. NPDC004270]